MVTVKKSEVPDNFAELVEKHCAALLSHQFTKNTPAPQAPHLIASCIRRVVYPIKDKRPDEFIIDYELVDDSPPPPTLEEKKHALLVAVIQAEDKATAEVIPAGKRRLYNLRYQELSTEEGPKSEDDNKFLVEYEDKMKRFAEIHRRGAEMMSEIEDLTEETVDNWSVGQF